MCQVELELNYGSPDHIQGPAYNRVPATHASQGMPCDFSKLAMDSPPPPLTVWLELKLLTKREHNHDSTVYAFQLPDKAASPNPNPLLLVKLTLALTPAPTLTPALTPTLTPTRPRPSACPRAPACTYVSPAKGAAAAAPMTSTGVTRRGLTPRSRATRCRAASRYSSPGWTAAWPRTGCMAWPSAARSASSFLAPRCGQRCSCRWPA